MSANRSIDPVTAEPHKFTVHGDNKALTRLWEAVHRYQDSDRDANPYAEPLVSSSTGDVITSFHPFLLHVVATAAGVELKKEGHKQSELDEAFAIFKKTIERLVR